MEKRTYIGMFLFYRMLIVRFRIPKLINDLSLLIVLSLLYSNVYSHDKPIEDDDGSVFLYDGIPVYVIVEGSYNFYVDAIYANNDLLYVNIKDLFEALSIPCYSKMNGSGLSGFIEHENQPYTIDISKNEITVGERSFNIDNGLVNEMGSLYLDASMFAEAFGISLSFNYRALTLILKSNFELPIIKQKRVEKLRKNIQKIRGEEIADTTIGRAYHLFKAGMIDWSAASYQKWGEQTDNRFGLGIGGELLYGELNASVNYYDKYEFDKRQLHYLWRWVDNDKTLIKQAQVGKIYNQTVAFLGAPVIGAVIRNSPTTVRKASGYYTISEFTEPNWTVELYINNVMVDYTKADASGLFVFKVPMVYGYTTLKMKFYGPMGEERTEERTMNLPYSIMPQNDYEYSLSAGLLEDSTSSRFGKGDFNYGVNSFLTVGGGFEYLSSIPNGAFIPYATATVQPYSKLTVKAEYAHGVKTRGVLSMYFMKNALLEIDYSKFVDGQLATRFNANEERKVKLSIPFRYKKIIGFSRFDFNQFVYKSFNYNQATAMVSVYYKQFSVNSTTLSNWINKENTYISSELSLSYRVNGYAIRPSVQYNASDNTLMFSRISLEKSFPRGYFTASYERNFLYKDNFFNLSLNFDLNFARTSVSASHSKHNMYTSESIQGSLAFGSGNNYVHASNNPSVGRGGISIYPFLDLNGNGIFDNGEPMVKLSSVRIMGSKAIFNENDSIVRISGLNPFTRYTITFSDTDLESISWRFKHKTYQVLIDPNQFKRVDVPVVVVGEYSGMAYLKKGNSLKGIGRILVNFYKKGSTNVYAKTLSESDGYIYCLEFEPGEYVARIDSAQLSNLDYNVSPRQIEFTIKPLVDGDMISGPDFVLNSNNESENTPNDTPSQTGNKANVIQDYSDTEREVTNGLIKDAPKDSLPQSGVKTDERMDKMKSGIDQNERGIAQQDNSIKDSIEITMDKLPTNKQMQTLVWGELCETFGNYYIQCGAFKYESTAKKLALFIEQNTDFIVGVALHNGLYKVRVECVPAKMNAEEIESQLTKIIGDDTLIVLRKYLTKP